MVNTLALGGIFLGISATAFLAFFSIWGSVNRRATARVTTLAERLDRAGIRMSAQEIVLTVSSAVAVSWLAVVFLLRPSLLFALLLLPAFAAAGVFGFYGLVAVKITRRLDAFVTQLEMALRLIASSVRVGLGLRQAFAIVIEELPDPSRYEFRRVIGQTNIGASIFDALDGLAQRMPCNETLMVARVFRVQSETGGDLARILDQLADTIKGRRQVHRKIASLTSEGRMSAWVLMLIPLGLGMFIVATQADMGYALLYTWIGHIVLITIAVLEILAFFSIRRILKVEV
jgi:Flp pilus assembly protein TadB